jgi:hypothetical protein
MLPYKDLEIDWMLQLENKLPTSMNQPIFIINLVSETNP